MVFNRAITREAVERKLVCGSRHTDLLNLSPVSQFACARILHPILLAEVAYLDSHKPVHREREVEYRVTCGKFTVFYFLMWPHPCSDICSTGLFSLAFFCSACGREICFECADALQQVSSHHISCSNSTLNAFADKFTKCHLYFEVGRATLRNPPSSHFSLSGG